MKGMPMTIDQRAVVVEAAQDEVVVVHDQRAAVAIEDDVDGEVERRLERRQIVLAELGSPGAGDRADDPVHLAVQHRRGGRFGRGRRRRRYRRCRGRQRCGRRRRHRTTMQRGVDGGDQLADLHVAAVVAVAGAAHRDVGTAERDVHAADQLADGDVAVGVAVAAARGRARQRAYGDGEDQQRADQRVSSLYSDRRRTDCEPP